MAKLLQKRADPNVEYCLPYDVFVDECRRVRLVPHGLPPLPDNKDCSGLKERGGGDLKLTVFSEINGHKVEMELVMFEYDIQASMTINEGVVSALQPVNHDMLMDFMENPDGLMERVPVRNNGTFSVYAHRQGNGNPPFISINVQDVRGIRELFLLMFGLPTEASFPPSKDRASKRMRRE